MEKVLAVALGLAAGACFSEQSSPEAANCDAGQLGCACASGELCLGGLSCIDSVCVAPGGTAGESAQGPETTADSSGTGEATTLDSGTDAATASATSTASSTSTSNTGPAADVVRIWISAETETGRFTGADRSIPADVRANEICNDEMPDFEACDLSAAVFSLGENNVASLPAIVPDLPVATAMGEMVGDSFASMLDGISQPLEDAGLGSTPYWTGSTAEGNEARSNCGNWGSDTMFNARVGDPTSVGTDWLSSPTTLSCTEARPVLCLCWSNER